MVKIVKIWGGIGNQLFQFYFSCYLKKLNPESNIVFYTTPDGNNVVHNLQDFRIDFPLVDLDVFINKNYYFRSEIIYRIVRFLVKIGCISIRDVLVDNGILNFEKIAGNSLFDGYWQWCSLVDEVYSEFPLVFDNSRLDQSQQRLIEYIWQGTSVSVHIRRGDKLQWRNRLRGWQLGKNYYVRSIEVVLGFIENPTFYIFSDDVQWVKDNAWFKDYKDVVFVEDYLPNYSSSYEMFAMSNCRVNILANSTFSWWAAYMNCREDKLVLAPKRWFRFWNKRRTRGLMPENWILITE